VCVVVRFEVVSMRVWVCCLLSLVTVWVCPSCKFANVFSGRKCRKGWCSFSCIIHESINAGCGVVCVLFVTVMKSWRCFQVICFPAVPGIVGSSFMPAFWYSFHCGVSAALCGCMGGSARVVNGLFVWYSLEPSVGSMLIVLCLECKAVCASVCRCGYIAV
jgi:hypothetical protein